MCYTMYCNMYIVHVRCMCKVELQVKIMHNDQKVLIIYTYVPCTGTRTSK